MAKCGVLAEVRIVLTLHKPYMPKPITRLATPCCDALCCPTEGLRPGPTSAFYIHLLSHFLSCMLVQPAMHFSFPSVLADMADAARP